MNRTFDGQHAFITGGGKGIGAAIARALATEGAHLTLTGRDEGALTTLATQLPRAQALALDVSDGAAVHQAIARASATYGPIAILINNAGLAETAPFLKTSPDLFRRLFEVNFLSVVHACQAVLPAMIAARYGRIVNIASLAGLMGVPYLAAYAASKHALVGLTRTLALETARQGITVNALCPGYVRTGMVERGVANIMAKTGLSESDAEAELVRRNPRGRMIEPEEVAAAALWLCRPGAESMTGQAISISGGELMP